MDIHRDLYYPLVVDKNPVNIHGFTPMHLAALNGHLEVCTQIIDVLEHKNPGNENGLTPL